MRGRAQKNAREKISRLAAGWTCRRFCCAKKIRASQTGLPVAIIIRLEKGRSRCHFGETPRAAEKILVGVSASIAFDPASELIAPTPAKEIIGAFPVWLSWRSEFSQKTFTRRRVRGESEKSSIKTRFCLGAPGGNRFNCPSTVITTNKQQIELWQKP
jgi:hypothetical protein